MAPDDVKPGWQTTEFWSSILAALAPWISQSVPADKASFISAAAVAIYAIARGIAKRR